MKKHDLFFITIITVFMVFIVMLIIPNKNKVIIRDKIIIEIDETKPIIALTFDDGPNKDYTVSILDILYDNNVAATFFIIGKNIENNEDVLKKIVAEGHEIENHTFEHLDLTKLNEKQIKEQIQMTQEKVNEVIEGYTLNYVRPPYGKREENVIESIDFPISLWSLDSEDWGSGDHKNIANRVINNVKDGDVIILHDTSAKSVKATELIVLNLVKRNFQFVTLKDLYKYRKDILENHKIYR